MPLSQLDTSIVSRKLLPLRLFCPEPAVAGQILPTLSTRADETSATETKQKNPFVKSDRVQNEKTRDATFGLVHQERRIPPPSTWSGGERTGAVRGPRRPRSRRSRDPGQPVEKQAAKPSLCSQNESGPQRTASPSDYLPA
jgi:hypothetical protein